MGVVPWAGIIVIIVYTFSNERINGWELRGLWGKNQKQKCLGLPNLKLFSADESETKWWEKQKIQTEAEMKLEVDRTSYHPLLDP